MRDFFKNSQISFNLFSTSAEHQLNICVPKEFLEKLAGKEAAITIVRYDYSLHFKIKGPNFYFSPREGLVVEGREIELESVEPVGWSERHRASMKAKLKQKSIDGGEIFLVFYEDGEFGVLFTEGTTEKGAYKATLSTEGNLLVIEYKDGKAIIPIRVQEWEEGKEYYLNIPVENREEISLVRELRKIFGYDNVEKLRKKIEEGELELVAYFNNGKHTTCSTERLRVIVPEGAETLEYVEIQPRLGRFGSTWELSDDDVERIRNASSDTDLGKIGRDKVAAVILGGGVPEIGNVKSVREEVRIIGTGKHVDIVIETEDGRFMVVEVETTGNSSIVEKRFRDGVYQIRKDYMGLIEQYGLDPSMMGREEPIKDVDSYWVFALYFDLENKVTKVIYDKLPEE